MPTRRLVDLSLLVKNSPSEPMTMNVKRLEHHRGAKKFCSRLRWNRRLPFYHRCKAWLKSWLYGTVIKPADFPDSAFLSLDIVTLPTHMGTHIDAPFHYGPNAKGDLGPTVESLPLELFYNRAVRLDLRYKKTGDYISCEDIKSALSKIDHQLTPGEIVLIWTGVDQLHGKPQYFAAGPGMSVEATEYLIDQGVQLIGTDTYGFDRPFPSMIGDFAKTRDKKHLWPTHMLGREKPYIQIERLANLGALPDKGFDVSCFPLKIDGIDASWVRAVGIVYE